MDTDRFDALARDLFTGPSRRGLLRTFLGSAVAFAGVADVGFPATDAKKRKKKKKCKGGKRKCGKKCILATECCGGCGAQRCCDGICADCCDDADCPTGGACESGTCVCPIGTTDCGDVCANLATNGDNCGACGIACESSECVHGACTCTTVDDCPAGCVGCVDRVEGGKACVAEPDVLVDCEVDDDCPLGSVCVDAGLAQFCSGVCQA